MFGWASWRDRWVNADFNIDVKHIIENEHIFEKYFIGDARIVNFWKFYYKNIYNFLEETHCWDYMFSLNCVREKAYVVAPIEHLVQNVGVIGTHALGKESATNKSISFEKKHYLITNKAVNIIPNKVYDELSFNILFNYPFSLKSRVKRFLSPVVRPIKGMLKYLSCHK